MEVDMALFVTNMNGFVLQKHIGTGPIHMSATDVFEVLADGDELEWIENNFTGIPAAKKHRSVRWYGDHAKFIVSNWK